MKKLKRFITYYYHKVMNNLKNDKLIGIMIFKRRYLKDEELCFRLKKNVFIISLSESSNETEYDIYFKIQRYKYDVLNVLDSLINKNIIEIKYVDYTLPLRIKDKYTKFNLIVENNKLISYTRKLK